MIHVTGSMWDKLGTEIPIIPTNGIVEPRREKAVMGGGVAAQARARFINILQHGNHVFYHEYHNVITFPTKDHFRDPADLDLIAQSTEELLALIDTMPRDTLYAMPKVGTGLGRRSWSEIEPIVRKLPDTVTLYTLEKIKFPIPYEEDPDDPGLLYNAR